MKTVVLMLFAVAIMVFSTRAYVQKHPKFNCTIMHDTKDIVDNAANSKDHTTFFAAIKTAGLVSALKGKGPFTIFAPTNTAFEKLPTGTFITLTKPENKVILSRILTYHVVAGKLDAKAIAEETKKGDGKATLKTISGGKLWAWIKGKKIILKDEKGNIATVTNPDLYQKNGVLHVTDTVLMPK